MQSYEPGLHGTHRSHTLSRRGFLSTLLASAAGSLLAACTGQPSASGSGTSPEDSTAAGQAPAQIAPSPTGAGTCARTPEQTEGPYYIDTGLIRSDITEGRPGLPLQLQLTVLRANGCQPIPNATVEIWHCDASGVYSGYGSAQLEGSPTLGTPSPGGATQPPPGGGTPPPRGGPEAMGAGHMDATNSERFLRGGQLSDANGAVAFQTIYPGWYMGRTTHIHVKVLTNGRELHTGQFYFDDAITDAVYAQPPYNARGQRSTTNSTDGIFRNGGQQSRLTLSRTSNGYTGTMTLVVNG